MKYTIYHIDMNSFFASVELLKYPQHKNKPFCVGGRGMRGVVSSANYVARNMGVSSAMPIAIAKKICPSLIISDVHFNEYNYYSYQIYTLLKSLVKKVEIGSIDEWYIDASDSIYETWNEFDFVSYLKQLILSKFKLECTIGCSWNKFLAKMSTNISKPNKFILLDRENFKSNIYELDISKMFSIGKKTSTFLKSYGIEKVKDILNQNYNESLIQNKLGITWYVIKQNVLGNGNTLVNNSVTPKSIGRSHTIIEMTEYKEFKLLFHEIANNLNMSLLNGMIGYMNISLKIKMKDNKVLTINRKSENEKKWINENELIISFDSLINKNNYNNIVNISVTLWPIIENYSNIEQINIFNINKYDELDLIATTINHKMKKNILSKASNLNKHYYKHSK